ncbi:hypothetical protein BDY24DRAFT_375751 [Mrakia frigida]|uniref:Vms1p n=1 Tax=Mrakia frigida TaxID=29902 RepID=UPI003FCC0964
MSSSLSSMIPLSATKGSSQHPRLQQQMNVFTLPLDILSALSVRSLQVPAAAATITEVEPEPSPSRQLPDSTEGGLTCGVCPGSRFEDVEEQRSHFKEDWHRYNVRVKMTLAGIGEGSSSKKCKGKVVNKEEFEGMVDDLSSISGSESSSSSITSNHNPSTTVDQVSNLLRKHHKISSRKPDSPPSDSDLDDLDPTDPSTLAFLQNRAALRTAILWFTPPPSILPDTQLGIYRALFPSHLTNPADFLPRLKELQLTEQDLKAGEGEERRWIMLMVAGGHFAGMVISLGGKRTGKKMVKGEAGEVRVLKHKTFHRYTTRRKQGGSQSKHDSGNGAANSIGAQMRRAGEVMLQEEIRALLESWSEDFNIAERVFIRGSDSGKKIFWGYEEAVIEKTDERIRTFPFPTRRPTLSELLRCYQELTRVKTSFLTESALAELESAYIASLTPKPQSRSTPSSNLPPSKSIASKAKLSEEEERDRERWRRLVEMIRKGKMDPLGAFWEKWSIGMGFGDGRGDGSLPGWLWEEEGKGKEGTLLMVAVVAGQEEVVRWLLEEKKMDPTVAVPSSSATKPSRNETTASGALIPSTTKEEQEDDAKPDDDATGSASAPPFRTAYDLSPNRSIRSVFRRTAHTHPELWNWTSLSPGGARVPSGLSAEMEEDQNAKKGERRKGLKEKMASRKKKEEVEELEVEPAVVVEKEKKAAPAGRVGGPQRLGGAVEGVGGTSGSLNGLSPEVRARIERERRARAAEARMAKGPGA